MHPVASRLFLLLALMALSACASGGKGPAPTPSQPNTHYKVGQPYQIEGNWYYPKEDYSYDETGIASWYGEEFEGKARTANGEIFNKDELTAAHKTLQLPCLARVTNLDNGRSIVVRVNDRGPFSGTRLIDVSQRAAQLLGFEKQGTAKVRVQVLADESKAIADALRHYGSTSSTASAAPVAPVDRAVLIPDAPKVSLQNVKPVAVAHQLPVTGSNQIYVQGGAFTSLDNAKKMQQTLSRIAPARITEAVVKGTKYYRVRIGPVSDVPKADGLMNKIGKMGVQGARTVVE